MARAGHYKAIQSSHPLLEVKRAGRKHLCAGVAIERGARPGRLQDVWMIGHSKRCLRTIEINTLYVFNCLIPPNLPDYCSAWPTCLVCAIETYAEYFTGPEVAYHLRPVTPERRDQVKRGLEQILETVKEIQETVLVEQPERFR